MASMITTNENASPTLFNSNLETGIRALVILNATYPSAFDLSQLTWFDHLLVHTGDIGGPESLHPSVPSRSGELLVRRRIIENSLTLMRRLHLVEVLPSPAGILYKATEEAYSFVDILRSKYSKELKARAEWLSVNVCNLDEGDLKELIVTRLDRWKIEFQEEAQSAE